MHPPPGMHGIDLHASEYRAEAFVRDQSDDFVHIPIPSIRLIIAWEGIRPGSMRQLMKHCKQRSCLALRGECSQENMESVQGERESMMARSILGCV